MHSNRAEASKEGAINDRAALASSSLSVYKHSTRHQLAICSHLQDPPGRKMPSNDWAPPLMALELGLRRSGGRSGGGGGGGTGGGSGERN